LPVALHREKINYFRFLCNLLIYLKAYTDLE
jgi:hypothetical protein